MGASRNKCPQEPGRLIDFQDGRFETTDVPDGTYDVVFEFDDYRAEARVVIEGRAPEPLTLTLRPK